MDFSHPQADTIRNWTEAILSHHAQRHQGHATQADLPFAAGDAPAYCAAAAAASRMGFIACDAEVIGRAWQHQTQRTGQFDPAAWPYLPEDFGLTLPAQRFAPCPTELGLYAVLPDADWVGRMARAGVPTVQLRFKSEDAAAIRREVRAAVEAVAGTSARLFINDHWQEALAAGAYGVHVGQEDLDALPAGALDTLRTQGMRLGVSTHGYAEMLRAAQAGPSYFALGAVFPTTLKRMATAPQGLARLHDYAKLLHGEPLVAIGGIGLPELPRVLETGVGSVAVVRALVQAEDPEATAALWMQRMSTHIKAS